MKKKLLIIVFVIYIIIALFATKALLDRNEHNVFVTKNNYYICNEKIKEYDESSLVRFDKNANFEKMVSEEVYYFDDNNELKYDKLTEYDKEKRIFKIDSSNYDISNLLGKPDRAYQLVGSILNVLTSRAFYLIFVIIPIFGLFIYEIYLLVIYMSHNKDGKDNDNDEKTNKKNK